MIDFEKLDTFVLAAETLSFSDAAKHLNLTQPTVSYHIKALEEEMGMQLFERRGSQLNLTEAGQLLLPWARKLINQSIEMQEMMLSLHDGVVGQLRIACSTTAGKYVLPQLAARFCHRYPGIRVSIPRCNPENVIPQLLENEANLGVISHELLDETFELQEFFEDLITLIVPANHPWAMRRVIEPDELINEAIIMREPTSGTRKVLLSELAKHDINLDDLNVFMELGNAEAIVRTVSAGYAVSFVSTLATACPLERGHVVDVKVVGLNLRRKIFMVRKRLESPHRPQEVFWGFVHSPKNIDLIEMAGVPGYLKQHQNSSKNKNNERD
ncbi:MAG: LysR substrate-binding domain-containing protein [Anaerolineales bacterium]|jgi:DNA-binding transcriptional LysR family regulator